MKLHVGTSGYSYKEWKGSFYPETLAAGDMLRFYAERLPAVEINNTFYRLPTESVLATWARQVPDTFRFALKASRRITHIKRLTEVDDETSYLLRTAGALGQRLGAILFQLPPHLRKDLPRLERFLDLVAARARSAFEFRHPSWFDEDVFASLRRHGAALCVADAADGPESDLVDTAAFGYLRLRRPAYDDDALASWARRVRARAWDDVFVFFKHEDAGTGPTLAQSFLRLAARA
jgi:uncharacterized protein YecE (DUF72 family)